MEPFFFDTPKKQLFGIYHAPQVVSNKNVAVLICNPVFQEYIRSHRTIKNLAEQLSKMGCHVLRFDYYGTGDSAGDLTDASLEEWQQNILTAEAELMELSGVSNVTLIGLRLGAALIGLHDSGNAKNAYLWEPTMNGEEYISKLESMHNAMLKDESRFPFERNNKEVKGETELLGFSLPNSLRNSIKEISLSESMLKSGRNTVFMTTKHNDSVQNLVSQVESFTQVELDLSYDWEELNKIEDLSIPYSVITKITELIK